MWQAKRGEREREKKRKRREREKKERKERRKEGRKDEDDRRRWTQQNGNRIKGSKGYVCTKGDGKGPRERTMKGKGREGRNGKRFQRKGIISASA